MSLSELKKYINDKKLIFGRDRSLKNLKKNLVKEIFLSSNADNIVKEDITVISKKFNVKVSQLEITADEMGVVVKKPFAVSVAALLKWK